MQQSNAPQRRGPIEGPNGRRLIRRVTWRSSTYKLMACLWVLGVFYIVWLIRDVFYYPFYASSKQPLTPKDTNDLLAPYVGRQECDISSLSLFSPPQPGDGERASSNPYCQSRDALLNAMSNGGRHGFDAAYTSQGKCQIDGLSFLVSGHFGFSEGLQRGNSGLLDTQTDLPFQDALIVGSLAPKYATFFGNSMESSFSPVDRAYLCGLLRVMRYTLKKEAVPLAGLTLVHPVFLMPSSLQPVLLPLGVCMTNFVEWSPEELAEIDPMDEWLTLAQASGRNTPFLWVGPTAPGLQKDSRDNIHASSWQYSQDTAQEARNRGLDALGMYNATLQADSWDGKHYGEKVALIQAMMVINWLAML
ncbi:similar to An02g04010 [Aspergillus luchuensis IFO 4308]|nr:similar to An02g04010 [Aspergillus luchuensis IFO 4308]